MMLVSVALSCSCCGTRVLCGLDLIWIGLVWIGTILSGPFQDVCIYQSVLNKPSVIIRLHAGWTMPLVSCLRAVRTAVSALSCVEIWKRTLRRLGLFIIAVVDSHSMISAHHRKSSPWAQTRHMYYMYVYRRARRSLYFYVAVCWRIVLSVFGPPTKKVQLAHDTCIHTA